MSLDEVSRKRKEEMDAVRAKYMKPAAAASASGATRLKFRSYRPSSDILKVRIIFSRSSLFIFILCIRSAA